MNVAVAREGAAVRRPSVLLLVNGPGELWGWGRPLAAALRRQGMEVRLRLHLSDTGLELGLEVYNPGQRVIAMCAALHSYYAVSEVSRRSR